MGESVPRIDILYLSTYSMTPIIYGKSIADYLRLVVRTLAYRLLLLSKFNGRLLVSISEYAHAWDPLRSGWIFKTEIYGCRFRRATTCERRTLACIAAARAISTRIRVQSIPIILELNRLSRGDTLSQTGAEATSVKARTATDVSSSVCLMVL